MRSPWTVRAGHRVVARDRPPAAWSGGCGRCCSRPCTRWPWPGWPSTPTTSRTRSRACRTARSLPPARLGAAAEAEAAPAIMRRVRRYVPARPGDRRLLRLHPATVVGPRIEVRSFLAAYRAYSARPASATRARYLAERVKAASARHPSRPVSGSVDSFRQLFASVRSGLRRLQVALHRDQLHDAVVGCPGLPWPSGWSWSRRWVINDDSDVAGTATAPAARRFSPRRAALALAEPARGDHGVEHRSSIDLDLPVVGSIMAQIGDPDARAPARARAWP